MWRRERPHRLVFWSNVLNNFDEDEWGSYFHMLRNTFDFVLELVDHPHLRRRTTNWRKPLEPRLQLAIALCFFCVCGCLHCECVLVHKVTAALKGPLLNSLLIIITIIITLFI